MHLTKAKFIAGAATAAAAAAMFALPSSSATAAPSILSDYTVTGTASVALSNIGNLVFTDTVGGAVLTCTHLGAPGVVHTGAHSFVTPPPGGSPFDSALDTTMTSSSITGCTNPTVGASTITPSGTWKFGVQSKAGSGTTATATGYLNFIQAHVAAATCSFDAAGYLPGTYTNSTGNFVTSAGAGLVISNVSGSACALVHVVNGHTAKLAGTIHINPAPTIS